jgi:hypothetical protein
MDVKVINQTLDIDLVNNDLNVNVREEIIDVDIAGAIVSITGSILRWAHDLFTLTALQISNKFVNLSNVPADPNGVILEIEGANTQIQDNSWEISGSSLSWNGKDIDGVLEEGDILSVKYQY